MDVDYASICIWYEVDYVVWSFLLKKFFKSWSLSKITKLLNLEYIIWFEMTEAK